MELFSLESPSKAIEPIPKPHPKVPQTQLEPIKFPAVPPRLFILFFLSTSQLHSEMFFLKTCLLLRYKSTYFSHVVHGGVMQYKKITS